MTARASDDYVRSFTSKKASELRAASRRPKFTEFIPTYEAEETVEDTLRGLNFEPVSRVMLEDGTVPFVKATDKDNGSVILVRLSDEDTVEKNDDELIYTLVNGDGVDASGKLAYLEDLGADVEGVAMECEDGVCVISKDEAQTPVELNYKFKTKTKTVTKVEAHLSYPVVSMSALKKNHHSVLASAQKACHNLRLKAIEHCRKYKAEFQRSLKCLIDAEMRFCRTEEAKVCALQRTLALLDAQIKAFPVCFDELCEKDKHNYKLIVYNYEVHNQMLDKVLHACMKIHHLKKEVAQVHQKLEEEIQFLSNNFNGIGKVHYPKGYIPPC